VKKTRFLTLARCLPLGEGNGNRELHVTSPGTLTEPTARRTHVHLIGYIIGNMRPFGHSPFGIHREFGRLPTAVHASLAAQSEFLGIPRTWFVEVAPRETWDNEIGSFARKLAKAFACDSYVCPRAASSGEILGLIEERQDCAEPRESQHPVFRGPPVLFGSARLG